VPATADPVGYFLSFDPFTASRIAGNAASAYLATGAHLRTREFTDQAIPIFAAAKSNASHGKPERTKNTHELIQ